MQYSYRSYSGKKKKYSFCYKIIELSDLKVHSLQNSAPRYTGSNFDICIMTEHIIYIFIFKFHIY